MTKTMTKTMMKTMKKMKATTKTVKKMRATTKTEMEVKMTMRSVNNALILDVHVDLIGSTMVMRVMTVVITRAREVRTMVRKGVRVMVPSGSELSSLSC